MSKRFHRRQFLKGAAGATLGSGVFGLPNILSSQAGPGKLRIAFIGIGGQGRVDLSNLAEENVVGLCDVDDKAYELTRKYLAEKRPDMDLAKAQTFTDYRRMFDRLEKQLDAIFIATPDHQHAKATMMAMERGLHVFVEKPMAKTIDEIRRLTAAAKKFKVITQMGNQGHSNEGLRALCEFIWAGAIGHVLETYSWGPRGRGGVGGRLPTKPVPAGLHWDEWIGPSPYRDYHDDLHPNNWRSWWDFGSGSLGDWGCHNLDASYMALKLDQRQPTCVEALVQIGGSEERFPVGNVVRWAFPAQGGLPPVKVNWYDGFKVIGSPPSVPHTVPNKPPIALEWEKKGIKISGDGGTILVGDKGVMYAYPYTQTFRILTEKPGEKFKPPPKTLPRVRGTHIANFLQACKTGKPAVSDFSYAGPMTEFVFLGQLAERAGVGKKVEWDAANMCCTNMAELNRIVKRLERKGWEL
jgi:predicted dehydrogenase